MDTEFLSHEYEANDCNIPVVSNGDSQVTSKTSGTQKNTNCSQPDIEVLRVDRKVTLITKHFKDILIRSYPNFVQIILSPVTTGLRHTVNANVCDELIDIMKQLLSVDDCKAILITGIGQTFCQGEKNITIG